MPKTANTFDTFTAIAEPRRRTLLEKIGDRELSVTQLVKVTRWNQPMVSKHLAVLRESGLVAERKAGRQRFYRINGKALQPVQLWVRQFEKHWNAQFTQLDHYLNELQSKGEKDD